MKVNVEVLDKPEWQSEFIAENINMKINEATNSNEHYGVPTNPKGQFKSGFRNTNHFGYYGLKRHEKRESVSR
jgi:hypothetical protein